MRCSSLNFFLIISACSCDFWSKFHISVSTAPELTRLTRIGARVYNSPRRIPSTPTPKEAGTFHPGLGLSSRTPAVSMMEDLGDLFRYLAPTLAPTLATNKGVKNRDLTDLNESHVRDLMNRVHHKI